MKNIEESLAAVISTATESFNNHGTDLTVGLQPRPMPLEAQDIEKLDEAIAKNFTVKKEPVYGYVTERDKGGNAIRTEFDIVRYQETFTPTSETPAKLRYAVLRPAESRHIVFHLTRLAAHRRSTTGMEALSVKISDIASDVSGVSEWAVINACRELRQKNSDWYPNTGEIIETIHAFDDLIKNTFNATPVKTVITKADKKSLTWKEVPKKDWVERHWRDYEGEALSMVKYAKEFSQIDQDFWIKETARRRNEMVLAGFTPQEIKD